MTIFSKAHHILRNLVIKEVSSVDRGAGEGVKVMLSKRAGDRATRVDIYLKREFSDDKRKELAASGAAMPGGEYPIENKADLKNAVEAFGRAKDKAATKKHIVSRAKALGAEDSLPEAWSVEKADFVKAMGPAIAKALPDLPADAAAELLAFLAKDVGAGDPDNGAVLFDDVLEAKEVTQEFCQEFYEATDTLRESIASILCDASADKAKLIDETLSQFTDHLRGILPAEMEKALAAGFAANADGVRSNGVEKMDELKKRLGLPATATEADIIKALDDKAKKDKEEADKKVEKLSDKHSEFMSNKKAKMPSGGKEAFQGMSSADRDKHMADNPIEADDDVEKSIASGSAFKTDDGTVLTKRDFNSDAAFNFAKSQAGKIAQQAIDLAKRDEDAAVVAFGKRATDLGFEAPFGEVLRKAFKGGDPEAIKKIEEQIKALREQARVGKLFNESGSSTTVSGDGYAQLMAKAAELRKADPKLTIEQAFTKAYEDPANVATVDLYKREKAA